MGDSIALSMMRAECFMSALHLARGNHRLAQDYAELALHVVGLEQDARRARQQGGRATATTSPWPAA